MKTALKITTLLFFSSGITFFIAYQSGYFFADAGPNDTLSNSRQEISIPDMERDENDQKMDEEGDEVRMKSNQFDSVHFPEPKEKAEVSEEEKLRMFSSKSLLISKPLRYTSKPVLPKIKVIPGSKSGHIEVDTRRFFPEYKPPVFGTPFMWSSLRDSLNRHK